MPRTTIEQELYRLFDDDPTVSSDKALKRIYFCFRSTSQQKSGRKPSIQQSDSSIICILFSKHMDTG